VAPRRARFPRRSHAPGAGRAKIGEKEPFVGGTLWVKADGGVFRGEHIVVDALKLCEKAAEPSQQPQVATRVAK
jgi:hypothetical protein